MTSTDDARDPDPAGRPWIVLDVDGVLMPYAPGEIGGREIGDFDLDRSGTWDDWAMHGTGPLSGAMGQALAGLDADLRLCTTWRWAADERLTRPLGWDPVPIIDLPFSEGWGKGQALLAAVREADPTPAAVVWVDDHIADVDLGTDALETLWWLAEDLGIPSMALAPDPYTGLTPHDVERIAQFLRDTTCARSAHRIWTFTPDTPQDVVDEMWRQTWGGSEHRIETSLPNQVLQTVDQAWDEVRGATAADAPGDATAAGAVRLPAALRSLVRSKHELGALPRARPDTAATCRDVAAGTVVGLHLGAQIAASRNVTPTIDVQTLHSKLLATLGAVHDDSPASEFDLSPALVLLRHVLPWDPTAPLLREGERLAAAAEAVLLEVLPHALPHRDGLLAVHRALGEADAATVALAPFVLALAGSAVGLSGLPVDLRLQLEGRDRDLVRETVGVIQGSARGGWGTLPSMVRPQDGPPILEHAPGDAGLLVGNLAGLPDALDLDVDAVVSLCRTGPDDDPADLPHLTAWLPDIADASNHLDLEGHFDDVVDRIVRWRRDGLEVFVHCAAGASRTPTITSLALHRLAAFPTPTAAWAALGEVLPTNPHNDLLQALLRRNAD